MAREAGPAGGASVSVIGIMAGRGGARKVCACAAPQPAGGASLVPCWCLPGSDRTIAPVALPQRTFSGTALASARRAVFTICYSQAFVSRAGKPGRAVVTYSAAPVQPLIHPPIFSLCVRAQTGNNGDAKGPAVPRARRDRVARGGVWMRAQLMCASVFLVSMPTGLSSREPA